MTQAKIQLFGSDLDGTLLGNPESASRFKEAWESLPQRARPLLVYNSGRLVRDILDLLPTANLPQPDYIIGGVGTQIHDLRRQQPLTEFDQRFQRGWDIEKIERILKSFPGVIQQPPQFLHPYKSSWYLHQAAPEKIEALRQQLREEGLEVTVVYSSGRDLDVLPAQTSKGHALQWLCEHLGIPLGAVLVAGDTANDAAMFLLPGVRGIVVENAQPELYSAVVTLPTFSATQVLADGVLEGLRHFGLVTAAPSPVARPISPPQLEPDLRALFSEAALASLNPDERQLIATAYERALAALRKNITPHGFCACSPADNDVTGTDVNYRAVWARDGAFAIASTIDLPDGDIRAVQKATLRTLFDHITPSGQIPANVRIDDGKPDYSGVGGICSIDSGLWAVIAFYLYVRKMRDHDFLAEYSDRLQRVMNWLSALDSNNDGLIEVPEAGDWTDLFGRSYHILYDEVLWYRANVCYGQLLEFQKQFDRAADYLRWAQFIRARILHAFWPTTEPGDPSARITFADRQFSLGDSSYLLPEITPFSFSWRCDVLGNVMAFLANVLDVNRARTAFKFMWAVGVNEPWPVANLYPPVQAGDPDWRPYYTVNLMNLPSHYHNGGIWPFIGGMWVRFINRLGLRDVACRELFRLAQLNRLGKNQEWEFNEWAHGRTGRPMGKAFQAWSAAAFIHACHELQMDPGQLSPE